ncbi:MAG: nicotinate-nucleotide adenylyltransferase [Lachnospiraceae bacterium]|nr:nicotinate-nucleotide adenylyltransferase [Lachnospiraceae bacterium]
MPEPSGKERRRIGILGGTFDPLHFGHLLLGEAAMEEAGLEKVVLMPSGCSYLKKDREISPAPARLQMVKLCVEGDGRFEVSDLEIRRGGNTYTADTIAEWHMLYPSDEIFFITGADTLRLMDEWIRPEEIFSGCTVLVAVREGTDEAALKEVIASYRRRFLAEIRLICAPRIDISASLIRERIREGKSIRYYVPEPVRRYIEKNKLYRDGYDG